MRLCNSRIVKPGSGGGQRQNRYESRRARSTRRMPKAKAQNSHRRNGEHRETFQSKNLEPLRARRRFAAETKRPPQIRGKQFGGTPLQAGDSARRCEFRRSVGSRHQHSSRNSLALRPGYIDEGAGPTKLFPVSSVANPLSRASRQSACAGHQRQPACARR